MVVRVCCWFQHSLDIYTDEGQLAQNRFVDGDAAGSSARILLPQKHIQVQSSKQGQFVLTSGRCICWEQLFNIRYLPKHLRYEGETNEVVVSLKKYFCVSFIHLIKQNLLIFINTRNTGIFLMLRSELDRKRESLTCCF